MLKYIRSSTPEVWPSHVIICDNYKFENNRQYALHKVGMKTRQNQQSQGCSCPIQSDNCDVSKKGCQELHELKTIHHFIKFNESPRFFWQQTVYLIAFIQASMETRRNYKVVIWKTFEKDLGVLGKGVLVQLFNRLHYLNQLT